MFASPWRFPHAAPSLVLLLAGLSVTPLPHHAAADEPTAGTPMASLTPEQRQLLQTIQTVTQQVNQRMQQGDYAQALVLSEQLLTHYRQLLPASQFPTGHPQLVTCYRQLCRASSQARDFPALMRWSLEGLAMARTLYNQDDFPRGHPNLAAMLHNVGTGYYRMSDWQSAREHYRLCIELACELESESASPGLQSLISEAYSRTGETFDREGKYIDALHSIRKALDHTARSQLPQSTERDDSRIARLLLMQGVLLRKTGSYQDAFSSIEQSRDIASRVYESARDMHDYETSLTATVELGLLQTHLGNFDSARRVFEDSLVVIDALFTELDKPFVGRGVVLCHLLNLALSSDDLTLLDDYRVLLEEYYRLDHSADGDAVTAIERVDIARTLGTAYQRMGDYSRAEEYYLQSLKEYAKTCTAENGTRAHPVVVNAYGYLADLYQKTGRYEDAFSKYAAALQMARQVFPHSSYPQGHPVLSGALHGMASHCWLIGEHAAAMQFFREVLVMREALYPSDKYPEGHRDLQLIYSDWAHVLFREQQIEAAERYLEKALAIATARFPEADYPQGHSELATIWEDLGRIARRRGDAESAFGFFERALRSHRGDGDERRSGGQFGIALVEAELGRTHWAVGDVPRAEDHLRRSLDLRRRTFPADLFPEGHPSIAHVLRDLGLVRLDRGEAADACALLSEAVHIEHALARSFFGGGSEAQLLNLAERKLRSLDALLTAWVASDSPADDIYTYVWQRRGFVTRLIGDRHRALRELSAAGESPAYRRYLDVRQELSRILLVSVTDNSRQVQQQLARVRELNGEKERLEQELTSLFEALPTEPDGPRELARMLPAEAVFVDFVKYRHHASGPAYLDREVSDDIDRYLAFVVLPGRPVVAVQLGDVDCIDQAVERWQQSLQHDEGGDAGADLRRLVWDPVHAAMSEATRTVYIAPDGPLATVPWGALPDAKTGGVLLEHFAIATVPRGDLLLGQLRDSRPAVRPSDRFLLVGNIDYGESEASHENWSMGIKRFHWTSLDASKRELEAIASCVAPRPLTLLSGSAASPEQVLGYLTRVRWAHFATHGFFVDDQCSQLLQLAGAMPGGELDDSDRGRGTVLRRSPWVRSGLALAGANRIGPRDELGIPQAAVGLLTAEAIAAMDARQLEMVVLSACETSRGDQADREGVLGIQTAFHVAGARNVIATLWKVDDEATAQLMQLFYRLWGGGELTPLEALRQAQLALIRQPATPALAARGPDLAARVPLPSGGPTGDCARIAPVRNWAAFVLSGSGH